MFNINRTPLKILVNYKGKILLADQARTIPSEQEEFINELRQITEK
jgi:hypothetical protein